MKEVVFLDTNVVLDLLGEREPFYFSAAKIATMADHGEITIIVSAISYSNVFYILSKFEDSDTARDKMRKFKVIAQTSDLTDQIIEKALVSAYPYFEDALQYYSAIQSNCKILITRSEQDFKTSSIPVMSPDEFLGTRL